MMIHRTKHFALVSGFLLLCSLAATCNAAEPAKVAFKSKPNQLEITIGGKPFAVYVFRDKEILRPYFTHVKTPSGIQATRNHPPLFGKEPDDHATMHPGIWLAFGDLGGADFWRNKGTVEHVKFLDAPTSKANQGSFTVLNRYRADDKTICTEVCRHTISVLPQGYLLEYDSEFSSEEGDFYFGDQEELGLGIRLASPLRVRDGNGTITNSDGAKNESQVWGKQALWCDYSGLVEGRRVGILLMPHPENFRRSWFHARDYGFVAANPFGRNAFTRGKKSKVVVKQGQTFRLRYGLLVYSAANEKPINHQLAYKIYCGKKRD